MNKYAVTRLARLSIIESFDKMDPTRSHELIPSQRIALRQSFRAAWRTIGATLGLVAAAVAVMGAAL